MPPRPTTAPTPALRYWRGQRALRQRELAERAGVDRTTVVRLEHGLPAGLETIHRLAEVLDVVPGDLLRQPPGRDDALVTPPVRE